MNNKTIRTLNDVVYTALFGKDTTALLIYFGLSPLCLRDPDDEDLRDCMGIEALTAIDLIERACTDALDGMGSVSFETARDIVQFHANQIAIEAKATAAGRGIDLLTGFEFVRQSDEQE